MEARAAQKHLGEVPVTDVESETPPEPDAATSRLGQDPAGLWDDFDAAVHNAEERASRLETGSPVEQLATETRADAEGEQSSDSDSSSSTSASDTQGTGDSSASDDDEEEASEVPDGGESTSRPEEESDESEEEDGEVTLGGQSPGHDDGGLDDTTILVEVIDDQTQSPVNADNEVPETSGDEEQDVVVDSAEMVVAHETVQSAVVEALGDVLHSTEAEINHVDLTAVTEIAEGTAEEPTAIQEVMAEPVTSVSTTMDVVTSQESTNTDLGEQQDTLAAGVAVTSSARKVMSSGIPAETVKIPVMRTANRKTVQASSTVMTAAPVVSNSIEGTTESNANLDDTTAASLVATSATSSATSTTNVR